MDDLNPLRDGETARENLSLAPRSRLWICRRRKSSRSSVAPISGCSARFGRTSAATGLSGPVPSGRLGCYGLGSGGWWGSRAFASRHLARDPHRYGRAHGGDDTTIGHGQGLSLARQLIPRSVHERLPDLSFPNAPRQTGSVPWAPMPP